MPFSRQPNNANKSIISKQHKTDLFIIRICLSEHETYFTFEQFPPNEKWDIKSYEEFAVDCAKKIVEYRADCEKYGTTMEELLKNFDDKMGALPEDDFQAASD